MWWFRVWYTIVAAGRIHGHMISGGDCEDKDVLRRCGSIASISGPGHRDSTAEWFDPALKAAAQLIRQWYRPVLTIWVR